MPTTSDPAGRATSLIRGTGTEQEGLGVTRLGTIVRTVGRGKQLDRSGLGEGALQEDMVVNHCATGVLLRADACRCTQAGRW